MGITKAEYFEAAADERSLPTVGFDTPPPAVPPAAPPVAPA
jgi:hypothetical protein